MQEHKSCHILEVLLVCGRKSIFRHNANSLHKFHVYRRAKFLQLYGHTQVFLD
nr:MAG TPA: hypothetical protein [Caudoviricetes sp.]